MEEFKEGLQQIGADVSEKTLRRWGDIDIITDHQRYSGEFRPGRGRGNVEDWPEESLLQAAGVLAIQNASAKRLTVPELLNLRILGDEIHKRGRCKLFYPDLNELIERNSPLQSLSFRQDAVDLPIPAESVTVVFDVFDDDPRHRRLYANYVCAKEKAWHSLHDKERAGPWLLTEPVWAHLYYSEETVIHHDGHLPDSYPQIFFSHSRLESKEGKDEPLFFFDGKDARAVPEYIKIHVVDMEI